mmetsp:Transcript_23680/g.52911  ORF Transcript_23680/g.52911 Transcript_23680/m.52911 type:complete len:397 (+) Transcript_23680:3-1193(+)
MLLHGVVDANLHLFLIGPLQIDDVLRSDIRREDDDAVLEVHDPALRVRDAPVVKHLQHDVEHVRVRFLHLIEEQDRVRTPPHRVRELSPLVVPNVARRGAQEAGHSVLLHVLGHVDSDERVLAVEHEFREGLGKFRLTHSGRSQEDEARDGLARVIQSRAAPLYAQRHGVHRLVLSHNPFLDLVAHPEDLVPLPVQHLARRYASPDRDDVGNVLRHHLVAKQLLLLFLALYVPVSYRGGGRAPLLLGVLRVDELRLKLRQRPVLKLGGLLEVVVVLRLLELEINLGDFLLELRDAVHGPLFGHPPLGEVFLLPFKVCNLAFEVLEPCPVGFGRPSVELLRRVAREAQLLHLELYDPPIDLVERRRLGRQLVLELGARLVDEIDRLVREETVGEVPR